jgi:hypothetical protein
VANDPPGCWNEIRAADDRSRADAILAVHEDSDSPPLLHRWQSVIQMFGLGDNRTERSKALLSFALGGDSLRADTLADRSALYQLHFRAVAWDEGSGQTITLDTTRRFVRDNAFPTGDGLVAFLEMPLPPGDWQVGVRATQRGDSSGAYALRRDLHIGGGAVSLSDIVLGINGVPAWTATDGKPFPVNAMAAWPVGSSAEMFFEVQGLADNDSYRTTIEVKPLDPKLKESISIGSNDRAGGPITHVRKSLGLERLPPGQYQLVVTVEAGRQRASRTQLITIAKPH